MQALIPEKLVYLTAVMISVNLGNLGNTVSGCFCVLSDLDFYIDIDINILVAIASFLLFVADSC